MQYLQLQSLWAEFEQHLVGARLQKVRAHGAQVLSLQWYHREAVVSVLDFAQGRSSFFLLDGPCPFSRTPARGLVMALRKYCVGLPLVALDGRPNDRWLGLRFADREGAHWQLVLELSGRHGNLFILNPQQQVLFALRADRSQRALRVGQPYVPPALPAGALGQRPDPLKLADLPGPLRMQRFAQAELQRHLGQQQQSLVQQGLQAVRQRLDRLKAQQDRLNQALDDLPQQDVWQYRAMHLQAAFAHPPPPGATAVQVPDYTQPEQPLVTVPLLPQLTLAENITRCYRQIKKIERRADYALEHLPAVEAQITVHQDALQRFAQAQEHLLTQPVLEPEMWVALQAIGVTWGVPQGFEKAAAGGFRSAEGREASSPLRRHARCFEWGSAKLWVGKSDKDNHILTFRYGKGNDTWCHVQDTPGSHVVCKGAWEADTLKAAAHLAAYYSPQRTAFLRGEPVAVSYTQVKYVKALKGAKPGQVQLQQFKTYRVRYDANFWEALHS